MLVRVLVFIAVVLPPVLVRADDAMWNDCKSYNDAISIPACTHIIDAQSESPRALAAAHNNRGIAYRRRNEFYAALADYNKAIELDPGSHKAHLNRAMALAKLQMTERALADLDMAIRLNPSDAKAYAARGFQLLEQDREAALADFRHAFQLRPELEFDADSSTASSLQESAKTLIAANKTDLALDALELAIRLDASDTGAVMARAGIRMDQAKYDLAIADYDLALNRDAKNSWAFAGRCLARIYKEDLEAALGDCESGKQNAPEKYAYPFEVNGYLLLKLKRYDEAVADLSESITRYPDAPAPYVYRARSNEKLGQRAAGKPDYEKALSLQPRHARDVEALEEARQALALSAPRPAPGTGTPKASKKKQPAKAKRTK